MSEDRWIETAPGVVERRRVFMLPLITVATLFLGGKIEADDSQQAGLMNAGELDWDSFLKQSVPTALELHKDSSGHGQDLYLFWIVAMASRLRLKEIPRAKLQRFSSLNPPVNFGVSFRGTPFFVVEWGLEPGAILPPHNHPNASVCTLGIEGEARIRNFEIAGESPEYSSKKSFQVRETHNEIISPGRLNTLSSKRDNIHTFQAGKDGARGIDISTLHGKNEDFSFLELGEKPIDPEKRIFEATWRKI